ncbi:MAG: enoyl-CoA hydratase/isomerase family protein, partial [Cryobacterium sp.]
MTSDTSPRETARTRVSVQILTEADHRIALVTFIAAPGAPVTWTPAALAELHDAVTALAAVELSAVAFVGSGSSFGAGADIAGFLHALAPADGERIAREGYAALNAISGLGVPTFAFVNGAALGGALELALRCDYRAVAAGTRAIGLPEVRLGLIPGWGGLASLCSLVGVETTAEIALVRSFSARHLNASESLRFGVTDVILPSEDFLAASLGWAGQVLDGTVTVGRGTGVSTIWSAETARASITRRIPAPLPAVEACLDLLTTWQSSAAALPSDVADRPLARLVSTDPIEDPTVRAFGALLHTDECRASLYSFFTLQAARKRSRPPVALSASSSPPRGAPTCGASTRVGVIGGGLMACQLAVLFADRLNAAV